MEGLFQGTWYHSKVKIEKETIVPIPPYQPYNPFDFYLSASEVRQGEKSLYLEFLDVDGDDPQAVFNFCERFGVLGQAENILKNSLQTAEFEYASAKNRENREAFIAKIAGSPDSRCYPPTTLCPPMSLTEFKGHQERIRGPLSPPERIRTLYSTQDLKKSISNWINDGIRDSRITPQLNWNIPKAQWELRWYSLDLTGFFTIMLMLDLLGPGKIHSCPRCQKFFVTSSSRTKFCSFSCGNVFKVKKFQQENIPNKGRPRKEQKKSRNLKTVIRKK